MTLITWSWLFLVLYVGAMVGFGIMGQRRIQHADDFATARGSYGPLFLALAFAASTASGATFLGSPALAYAWGMSAIWSAFLYPIGVYLGVLIAMRLVATAGNRFGSRSIPEYLGDRYQSDGIRILVALFSLVLFFYIAGQLISGLVMFETMLGVPPFWALVISTLVLLTYVTLGGAHADILTDGVQGFLMLALAIVVIVIFIFGVGLDNGFSGMLTSLHDQDPNLTGTLNPDTPLFHSWWAIVAILLAHMPLGLLPHLGNKLWALKQQDQRIQFVRLAFFFGLTMGMLTLGGLTARALLGDALLMPGHTANESLPALFIELFPTWVAALIGIGVLSAVMSTADGLVVSSSQIIANDIYRRSLVPRYFKHLDEQEVDHRVLLISRWSTGVVLILCMGLAWALMDKNIAMVVWIGTGGMMAAFAGPLVVGALWRGVTKAGAFAGLISGMGVFIVLHAQLLNAAWFGSSGIGHEAVTWLLREGPNPYSCAAMGEIVSIVLTVSVSKLTKQLPKEHLNELFASE